MTLIDASGREAELDSVISDYNKGYLVAIEVEHHKIHEGAHHFVQDYDSDVDVAGPKYWHIKTPNTTTRFHFLFQINAGLPVLVQMFKDATIAVEGDGTLIDSINNDLNLPNGSALSVYKDPTVTDDGTEIMTYVIGTVGTAPVGASGESLKRENEVILKQNSSHLIKATSYYANTPLSVNMRWYEVVPHAEDSP